MQSSKETSWSDYFSAITSAAVPAKSRDLPIHNRDVDEWGPGFRRDSGRIGQATGVKMVEQPMLRGTLRAAGAVFASFLATPASPLAATAFSGVAAGDMASNDAILWTRAFDPTTGRPLAAAVTAVTALWRPGKLRFLIGVKNPLPIDRPRPPEKTAPCGAPPVARFATPVGLCPPFVTHPATLPHPD